MKKTPQNEQNTQIFKELYEHACADIQKNYLEDNNRDIKLENYVQSAHTSYLGLWILALQNITNKNIIVVCPSDEESSIMTLEINTYKRLLHSQLSEQQDNNTHFLPSWGCVMGSALSQYASSRLERSQALHSLVHSLEHEKNNLHIINCSVPTYSQLLPPRETVNESSLTLSVGSECDPVELAQVLSSYNFLRTPQISGIGEFSVRGELLDIYMYTNEESLVASQKSDTALGGAWRIRFDFGLIESIEELPMSSDGVSLKKTKSLKIYPLVEHVWNKSDAQNVLDIKNKLPEVSSTVLENTKNKLEEQLFDEFDYLYYPFLYKKQSHISAYCDEPLVLHCNFELADTRAHKYKSEYSKLFLDSSHIQCIPRPERVNEIILQHTKNIPSIKILHSTQAENEDSPNDLESDKEYKIYSLGDFAISGFAGNIKYFEKQSLTQMEDNSTEKNTYITLCSSGEQQQERVNLLVSDEVQSHTHFSKSIADIKKGFRIHAKDTYIIYSEADVLGKKLFSIDSNLVEHIASIDTIEPDDLVVHVRYGIGKFCGLKRMNIQGAEKDFMHLMYKDKSSLYVPIEQMNMIQKYIGKQSKEVILDTIGGSAWEKRKKKVMKQVEDLSQDLLHLQAQRNTRVGFAFPPAAEWEKEFIKQFPFPETKDQLKTWEEIESDMMASQPMDRLLVGDVGFGKTELAFRAAFKAMSAGKQVAFLVPTTILAEQHYHSALERCKNFPISIGMLSRFVDKKTQRQTIEALGRGEVEFLIGTHRILQADVKFKDIGLVIIDEEHRFGVKDKEKIKQFKNTVDCLALSATPIPRTLYQSLIHVRHLSTLTTAPNDRKPIKTFVEKYSDRIVKHAIEQEIERKGQVFFLHNRVRSLEEVKMYIQTLVPMATVVTASGQMSAKELENTMHTFVHGGANVLISTTIIENGIDIPSVNTIIIDRADMYGVSQLYQLRGRVGRSDKTAYAYLLYPDENRISDVALKRLTTISDYTELGSGFHIAMKDLEVRGAGNLLGKEQSGSIFSVGYEYYLQLLDKAISKASGQELAEDDVVLDLHYTGFIPSNYVSDSGTKMDIYRRIARIKTDEEYEKEIAYLEKSYGAIPIEIENLLCISKIKIISKKLHISMLKDRDGIMDVHLSNLALLAKKQHIHKNIMKLIADGKIRIHSDKPDVLRIPYDKKIQLEEKHSLLKDCLSFIAENK